MRERLSFTFRWDPASDCVSERERDLFEWVYGSKELVRWEEMGKGAGCIGSKGLLSKKKAPTENAGGGPSTTTAAPPATATTPNTQEQQQEEEAKTNNSDLQLDEEKPVASSTTAPPTEEVAASLNPTTYKVKLFIVWVCSSWWVVEFLQRIWAGISVLVSPPRSAFSLLLTDLTQCEILGFSRASSVTYPPPPPPIVPKKFLEQFDSWVFIF